MSEICCFKGHDLKFYWTINWVVILLGIFLLALTLLLFIFPKNKENQRCVVKIQVGDLSNKKEKIPTVLVFTEEDKYGLYSNLLFKYFLAEGVVCGHELFVASAKEHPDNILKELPAPLLDDTYRNELGEEATAVKSEDFQDSMKIAWRYQNLPKTEASPTSTKFGHYYDVSKTMPPELFQSRNWHSFYLPEELSLHPLPLHLPCKLTPARRAYTRLLQSIQRIIYQEGFDGSDPQKKQKNILRIGIQSLGSMLWGDDICSSDTPEDIHSLTKFLYVLRALLRKSLSACIITVPAHLIQNKAIMERVTNLSDMVVGLESFIGSERETNPLYKDYHGLVHVHQIPRLNSLICDVSDTKDLAFRLKRKLFTIEVRETVLFHYLEPKRWTYFLLHHQMMVNVAWHCFGVWDFTLK
uniref:Elongator complex protein 4 n=1 Tax=Strix occidentalis caurina TaxID=311401 RepID=A0A8D0FP51_STROC